MAHVEKKKQNLGSYMKEIEKKDVIALGTCYTLDTMLNDFNVIVHKQKILKIWKYYYFKKFK